jgi:hypothetical protein
MGWRVLFARTPTSFTVCKWRAASWHSDPAETSALFELSTRYERRSMIITANQPFGE